MRVWVDLSNSPHVELFGPIVDHLAARGDEVVLTARDHAQTVQLAQPRWPQLTVIGGPSPPGRAAKAAGIVRRAADLARFAAGRRIDVAVSHGSYAQLAAAWTLGIPALTLMDYEFQPANHVSFRLARRVIVPAAFPEEALRRCGARRKTLRYAGYKEELYLAGFRAGPRRPRVARARRDARHRRAAAAARRLALPPRPQRALRRGRAGGRRRPVRAGACSSPARPTGPRGRSGSPARSSPRSRWTGRRCSPSPTSTIGAGGTMNRESALLGTPTYTVFAGRLAAVDAALIREGRLVDLRAAGAAPIVAKKPERAATGIPALRRTVLLDALDRGLAEISARAAATGSARAGTPATTCSGPDVARDDGAGADERTLADRDAAHDHRTRAERRAPADARGQELPVVVASGARRRRSSRAASCR